MKWTFSSYFCIRILAGAVILAIVGKKAGLDLRIHLLVYDVEKQLWLAGALAIILLFFFTGMNLARVSLNRLFLLGIYVQTVFLNT